MTVMGRSAPPMMAPSWSNGSLLPKSTTKPVFLELLVKVTVVPTLMQNALLDLASGMLGVALASVPPLRLMSMVQGVEAEPHVFASAQILSGFELEQTSPLIFFFGVLADYETSQEQWQGEQTTKNCEIAANLH